MIEALGRDAGGEVEEVSCVEEREDVRMVEVRDCFRVPESTT